ncbi:MAG TPA: hypothetical protein DCZ34_03320 [Clostridiales bacterium]|nr:hypothetical protein [Clostridiales bacterium]
MKNRFNIFNLSTAIVFLVAFIFLMLSYITQIMFLPATVMFCAGFIMLSVALIKAYLEYQKTQKEVSDAIEMDAASGPDGAEYVMETEKSSKKKRKAKKYNNFDRLLPIILCLVAAGLFVYLMIRAFVGLF